jgi:replication-associated recombination protein RarA
MVKLESKIQQKVLGPGHSVPLEEYGRPFIRGSKNSPRWRTDAAQDLDEFIGQAEIVGEGRSFDAQSCDRLTSSIFWGPPGTGKTTLSSNRATRRRPVVKLNAVTSGVAEVRDVIKGPSHC